MGGVYLGFFYVFSCLLDDMKILVGFVFGFFMSLDDACSRTGVVTIVVYF